MNSLRPIIRLLVLTACVLRGTTGPASVTLAKVITDQVYSSARDPRRQQGLYIEALVAEFLLRPAPEKGKPVERFARVRLGEI